MATNKPDISEINTGELKTHPFPVPIEKAFRISIVECAYQDIQQHAKENASIEICGVLIGNIFKDEDGPYLRISASVRGEYASNSAGQVTFTQETWAYINEIKDSKHPEERIVGWYHSHPEFGIFLSPQDNFIQKSFFSEPWQVAFVVDPISNMEGFFAWHKGSPVLVGKHWIDGTELYAAKPSDTNRIVYDKLDELVRMVTTSGRNKLRTSYILLGLFIVATLSLAIILANQLSLKKTISIINPPSVANKTSTPLVESQLKDELLLKFKQNALLSPLKIHVVQEGKRIWCRGEVYTWIQKDLIGQIAKSITGIESVDLLGVLVTHSYITSEGDTLEKIAERIYGDNRKWLDIYRANMGVINDPNKIWPFITLKLPE